MESASAVQFAQALLVTPVLAGFASRYPGEPVHYLVVALAFYLTGFAIFVREWPCPWPGRFGHHEIFHAMLILGALSIHASVAHVVIGM